MANEVMREFVKSNLSLEDAARIKRKLNIASDFNGTYASLVDKPAIFSGVYADLTGKPTLFDGAYASLTGKPTLFSGAYTDLTGKPALGTLASQNGTFSGTASGTNTGDQTNVTGNAATATKLQTARTINGVSFDGTANINLPAGDAGDAGNLTGLILASNVITSSLVAFGATPTLVTPILGVATATSINKVIITPPAVGATLTIATGATLTASATATVSGANTGDQTTISGNAGSATVLQSARNINGTSFNGSADITVAAAAGTLTGATLAAGVTASSLTSFGATPTLVTPVLGVATGTSLAATGAITSSSASAKIGYATGAGSTITQQTSKATGVTINAVCGQITTNGAALAAAAEVSFLVTNSSCAATDVPVVALASGGTTNTYFLGIEAVSAGSFRIVITNASVTSRSEALVINFVIIKGVSS